MKRHVLLTAAMAGAGMALLGGAALAAMAPEAKAAPAALPAEAEARAEPGKPPTAKLEEVLAKLVAEGKLSAAQRDAILAALREAAGKAHERAPAFGAKHALAGAMKAAAAYLGMTERELGAALRDGRSVAAVAAEKGRTREGVIAAIVADATRRIDEAAAAGKVTAEQAPKAKAELAAAAAKLVDAKHEKHPVTKGDRRGTERELPDVHALIGRYLSDAVAYLGVAPDVIQRHLREGKSLAEIAAANGRTREGLVAAIVAPANGRIDALAAAGKLSAQAAARAKEQTAAAAGKIVDAKRGVRSERGKRP
ncbi:MAG TPA: hypothetical protein VFM93_14765 [Candidatus Limnocylindria bacterium]|nr:hypothetical protein [Candidatus Limnocylindria bacterium]